MNFHFRFLAQVPRDALVFFREAAEALIVERGAVDAVAAALAHISGTTEVQSRSLLCSEKVGYSMNLFLLLSDHCFSLL